MKNTMNCKMVIPEEFYVLEYNEMIAIEGGTQIVLDRRYLDKNTCLAEAGYIKQYGGMPGMTQDEIAKEIYAHAVLYYNVAPTFDAIATAVYNIYGTERSLARERAEYIKSHANPVDLGGDTAIRTYVFNVLWNW